MPGAKISTADSFYLIDFIEKQSDTFRVRSVALFKNQIELVDRSKFIPYKTALKKNKKN